MLARRVRMARGRLSLVPPIRTKTAKSVHLELSRTRQLVTELARACLILVGLIGSANALRAKVFLASSAKLMPVCLKRLVSFGNFQIVIESFSTSNSQQICNFHLITTGVSLASTARTHQRMFAQHLATALV